MKASTAIVGQEKKFEPFDLTIRVETADELNYLYAMFNRSDFGMCEFIKGSQFHGLTGMPIVRVDTKPVFDELCRQCERNLS